MHKPSTTLIPSTCRPPTLRLFQVRFFIVFSFQVRVPNAGCSPPPHCHTVSITIFEKGWSIKYNLRVREVKVNGGENLTV